MRDFLTTGWPWVGLGMAALLLVLLFFTQVFRLDIGRPRLRDLAWLAWLAVPLYQLHQFEEHGIDLLGHAYAFRGSLCGLLGYSDALTCPIPVSFITSVNLATVWGGIALSAFLGRRRPLIALSAFAIPFVNGLWHTVMAIAQGFRYNPGVGTAVLLFLPASIWAFRNAPAEQVGRRGVLLVVASGVVLHMVLIGSLFLYIRGAIGEVTLDGVQIVNAFVPIVFAFAGRHPRSET